MLIGGGWDPREHDSRRLEELTFPNPFPTAMKTAPGDFSEGHFRW
jgi:hypothetical protein